MITIKSNDQKLHLTWSTGEYELVGSLIDGSLQPEGIILNPITIGSPERHWRMMRHKEFDLCELSMASYLMMSARDSDFIAIPVFAHRRFRHSYIFVNASQIKKPKDLIGKKVGLRTFQATAGVWARGILEEEYGVPINSINWYTQDEEDIPFDNPKQLSLEKLPEGTDIDLMLQKGELQGVIYPETLPSINEGNSQVKRLFDDYKTEEMKYFKKTGIFPIMHAVVIKKELVNEHPWVPYSLLKAFRKALGICYKKMQNPRRYAMPWVMDLMEEQKALMGEDPWKFDFYSNKRTLDKLIEYSYKQGTIDRKIPAEELFVPSTLDKKPSYV